MRKVCKTCDYWKLYIKAGDYCACGGLSGGPFPGTQLYTHPLDSCKTWKERENLYKNDYSWMCPPKGLQ